MAPESVVNISLNDLIQTFIRLSYGFFFVVTIWKGQIQY